MKHNTICALGSGTMGLFTVLPFALAGHDVCLYVRNHMKISPAMDNLQKALDAFAHHDLINTSDIRDIMGRITPTSSLQEAAEGADFVIESISENLKIKQGIFQQLDNICPSHAIFATGTSALNPTEIADVLSEERQGNFVVAHFFNPPQLIPLVEIVPGEQTSQKTVDTTFQLMQSIGKDPVALHHASPGFIVNVAQIYILEAACQLVTSGIANAETVDRAVREGLNLLTMDIASEIVEYGAGRLAQNLNSQDSSAFINGTIKMAMLRAAHELVTSRVASAQDVAGAIKSSLALRLPETGPLESADLGGLDIFQAIFETLNVPVPHLITQAIATRGLGAKTGAGLYEWSDDSLTAIRARRTAALFRHLKARNIIAAPIRNPYRPVKDDWHLELVTAQS